MIQAKVIITLLVLLPLWGFSQKTEGELSKKQIRKARPTYIDLSAGINMGKFRDFATSPLFYSGALKTFAISRLKADSKREAEMGISFGFGNFSSSVNDNTYMSFMQILSFNYSQLYVIKSLSSEKWNFKVGGLCNATYHFRNNPHLFNNSEGMDLFATLFGSAKISRDISNLRRIAFFNIKPAKRILAFRLNIGLINNTYRNAYAYSGQEAILNDDSSRAYEFKIASGARFSSGLDYTVYLKNKNGIQVSYEWDAYKTGGNLDKFEMSNHTFKIALLFNKR